jgi:hypothetical protein
MPLDAPVFGGLRFVSDLPSLVDHSLLPLLRSLMRLCGNLAGA